MEFNVTYQMSTFLNAWCRLYEHTLYSRKTASINKLNLIALYFSVCKGRWRWSTSHIHSCPKDWSTRFGK